MFLPLLFFAIAACQAKPQYIYAAPYAPNYAYADLQNSQYHAQDGIGQFHYGYATPNSAKEEIKTADGVVQGSYSYVDANNVLQTVRYISDALGFRVAATNLPVGPIPAEPPAAASYVAPYPAYYAPAYNYIPQPAYSIPAATVDEALDIRTGDASTDAIAPAVVPIQSLYHSQDELGAYQFGYSDPNSNRVESKDVNGVVSGSYNYVDFDGKPQTVTYIADGNGFRVTASNLPVFEQELPQPVQDTPEVVAAREAHLQLVEEEKQRQSLEETTYELPAEPVAAVEVALEPVAAVPASVAAYQTYPVYYAPNYGYQYIPSTVAVHATQHHAQDVLGQYNYGYSNENSAKQEFRTADGIVQGSYSYVDGNGLVQTVNYVADEGGFRVAATNLPVGPVPAVYDQPAISSPSEPVISKDEELDIRTGAIDA